MTKETAELSKIFSNFENDQNFNTFSNKIKGFYGTDDATFIKILLKAVKGDNRELNDWIFNLPSTYDKILAWAGKVKTDGGEKITWLVGYIDTVGQTEVRKLLDDAWGAICENKLFFNPSKKPPYITYLTSIVSSEWQKNQDISSLLNTTPQFGRVGMFVESTALSHNKPLTPAHHEEVNMSSDIEIFQANYSKNAITEDSDWKMPLSSDFLIDKTKILFERVKHFCTKETISFYEKNVVPNANIITKLHTEIHNHGHFLGPFVYSQAEKNEESYEAIEEYRACLISSSVAEHLKIEKEIYFGLPVHIFLMRFLGYGLDYFLTKNEDIVSIREMEVGVLFFDLLEKKKGIEIIEGKLHINSVLFPDIYKQEVENIHSLEEKYKKSKKKGLNLIAKKYRDSIYVNDRNIQSFYEFLNPQSIQKHQNN